MLYLLADESLDRANVSTIVAVTVRTTQGCTVHGALHVDDPHLEVRGATIGVDDGAFFDRGDHNRSLRPGDAQVETHERIEDSPDNGTTEGTLEVQHLGRWRRANLQTVDEVPEHALAWPMDGEPPLRLTPWRMDEVEGDVLLVTVEGSQTASPTAGVCDVRFSHDVNTANRRLSYDAQRYRFDPANVSRLASFAHFRENRCPNAYTLVPDQEAITRRIGDYGNLTIAFADNGTVNVDGRTWLSPGGNVTFDYNETVENEYETYEAHGDVEVTHHGSWPRSSLAPEPWR